MQSTNPATAFDDKETRTAEMHQTIETWCEELTTLVAEATASENFQAWLDIQSRFHEYSHRNTLLIHRQYPEATKVAGYKTWQTEFDRQVKTGEQAIWIWAPIIAKQCPECGNSPSYHERTDCSYSETPSSEWSRGPVAFRPVSVFDISQTEGTPLPELDTDATGTADECYHQLCNACDTLDVSLTVVETAAWGHGSAKGVCRTAGPDTEPTPVELKKRDDTAAMAGTLVHEYAHALLHAGRTDAPSEQSKREVEAEAVAYVVGRHFGLDMSGSAFYLAAWHGERPEQISDRLGRITQTAKTIIEAVDSSRSCAKLRKRDDRY